MRVIGDVPAREYDRAMVVLARYRAGRAKARPLLNGKGVSLPVGLRYRLLKLKGKPWVLMHHARYNRAITGKGL